MDDKTYRSKIGLELVVPLVLLLGGLIVLSVSYREWLLLSILVLTIALIGYTFLTTRYQIKANSLIITSGFFYKTTVPIDSIKYIRKTNHLISSPAASLDRLEVGYHQTDHVIISPKEKQTFVRHLCQKNASITVNLPS